MIKVWGCLIGGVLLVVGMGVGKIYTSRTWDEKSRLTVFDVGPAIVIESINPLEREGIRLIIDKNVLVESVGGRGNWLAGSIGSAGDQRWAADSIASYFGVAYDGILTRMGVWDRWRYTSWKREVQWREIDLAGGGLVKKQVQPDKVEVYVRDQQFDEFAKNAFVDNVILSEGISTGIINSTGTTGMGNHTARFLESRGIRVAYVSGQPDAVGKCEVRGRDELKTSKTATFLQKWFKCNYVLQESGARELILVVGSEYRSWWLGVTN